MADSGRLTGSRPTGQANLRCLGASRFDPGRRLYPHLITSTPRKPPIPRGHRQWLDIA